jgi:prevent-host-death family protein
MSELTQADALGVAEAKARFSELIERVSRGERIIVSRHGRPVVALVRPDQVERISVRPLGLLAVAGALADWDDLPEAVEEIYRQRRRSRDRKVAELG